MHLNAGTSTAMLVHHRVGESVASMESPRPALPGGDDGVARLAVVGIEELHHRFLGVLRAVSCVRKSRPKCRPSTSESTRIGRDAPEDGVDQVDHRRTIDTHVDTFVERRAFGEHLVERLEDLRRRPASRSTASRRRRRAATEVARRPRPRGSRPRRVGSREAGSRRCPRTRRGAGARRRRAGTRVRPVAPADRVRSGSSTTVVEAGEAALPHQPGAERIDATTTSKARGAASEVAEVAVDRESVDAGGGSTARRERLPQ